MCPASSSLRVKPDAPADAPGKRAVGFPSPADDFLETQLDLNDYLAGRREATFFLRVKGHAMAGAGIGDGDLLIVDRSAPARHGDIVVAVIHGELVVRRLCRNGGAIRLECADSTHALIKVLAENELLIWGVVKHAVHSF